MATLPDRTDCIDQLSDVTGDFQPNYICTDRPPTSGVDPYRERFAFYSNCTDKGEDGSGPASGVRD